MLSNVDHRWILTKKWLSKKQMHLKLIFSSGIRYTLLSHKKWGHHIWHDSLIKFLLHISKNVSLGYLSKLQWLFSKKKGNYWSLMLSSRILMLLRCVRWYLCWLIGLCMSIKHDYLVNLFKTLQLNAKVVPVSISFSMTFLRRP